VIDRLGLIIERPILALLDIDKDTELEVRTDGEALIIRLAKLTKRARIRASAKKVMGIHDETLRSAVFDEDDATMEVPRLRELLEVSDVRGDEDAILLERLLQDVEVASPCHPSIANMRGVDSFDGCAEGEGDRRRNVLVEEQLNEPHEAVRHGGTPS
jgi:hypothetical protein